MGSLHGAAAVLVAVASSAAFAAACSGGHPSSAAADAADVGDPVDVPIDGLPHDLVLTHARGDAVFDTPFREPDGLGPLYIRDHCGACHAGAARGPGLIQTMVLVGADGVTPAVDQSALAYGHTERPLLAAGAKTPLLPPAGLPDGGVNVGIRVGPSIFGRGYMEAVLDSEILRIEAEQAARTDGIHGRINRVVYASEGTEDPAFHTHALGDVDLVGRFGLKARSATLDDFVAGAFQGDMGITSPLRPAELPNPDGLTDDRKPGVDVPMETLAAVTTYVRTIAIPRRTLTGAGRALFDQCKCSVCHVPSLKTRADYPITALAGIDAPVYTDFLLHDWGVDAADGMTDQSAGPRMWRTAALIGLRFNKTYLHDGRAHSVAEAIAMHASPGSEPDVAAQLYLHLSTSDLDTLLAYVTAL
jgi:CxxC motif-containing protein (DUF1111 family)